MNITTSQKKELDSIIQKISNIFPDKCVKIANKELVSNVLESMISDVLDKIIDFSSKEAANESTPDDRFRFLVYKSYSMWKYVSKNINDLRIRIVDIREGANKYLRLEPLSILLVFLKSDSKDYLIPHISSLLLDEGGDDFHLFIPEYDSIQKEDNGSCEFDNEGILKDVEYVKCCDNEELLELFRLLSSIGTFRPAKDYDSDGTDEKLLLHDKITEILSRISNIFS